MSTGSTDDCKNNEFSTRMYKKEDKTTGRTTEEVQKEDESIPLVSFLK
jgi:hypothetical protein